MKDNRIEDERIISERRKIQSDAYGILVYCLLISIVIQQVLMRAPFSQFAIEFFCLCGAGIYIVLRHIYSGIDIWHSGTQNSKKVLLNALIAGAIGIILQIVLIGETNALNIAIFTLEFIAFYFAVHMIFFRLIKKKQESMDESLNDDEETDE